MNQTSHGFESEIASARRFAFGKNWSRFLELLEPERIAAAEASLKTMLNVDRLDGKTFLDIGSGSGLFSLAARRLGASVTSFDFDPDSVACTENLREQFYPNDVKWRTQRGSVLAREFMDQIPPHDVVYSWGVLHHTGHMHQAVDEAIRRVSPGGMLFIALYRKTWFCPVWRLEKRAYVASPPWLRGAMRTTYEATIGLAYRLKHRGPLRRGMDYDRDLDDWLGGYPYESITPRALKAFVTRRGFTLAKQVIKTEGIHWTPGCDEYLFTRTS